MSKIVTIHGQPLASVLRVTPLSVFHHLRALWIARLIDTDALFLGNLVIASMQQYDTTTVSFSHLDAQGAYCALPRGGQVLSGPVSKDRLSFTLALQALHFRAGILNHKDNDALDEEDAGLRHFTRSPVSARSHYTAETPITFRLPVGSEEEYAPYIGNLFTEEMSKLTTRCELSMKG